MYIPDHEKNRITRAIQELEPLAQVQFETNQMRHHDRGKLNCCVVVVCLPIGVRISASAVRRVVEKKGRLAGADVLYDYDFMSILD